MPTIIFTIKFVALLVKVPCYIVNGVVAFGHLSYSVLIIDVTVYIN